MADQRTDVGFDIKALSKSDGSHNRAVIQRALDGAAAANPATREPLRLPSDRTPMTGGLVMPSGVSLGGLPGAVLARTDTGPAPVIHVLGAGTAIRDLTIELPASEPGPHDGARHTAITVGDYLYPTRPAWVEDVSIEQVRIVRPSQCAANSIAVMGAVRRLTITDVEIDGGGTGIAVHWGAVATSVADITGPSFHPYELRIASVVVRNAFEGFYLSSVHDVSVTDVHCHDVEIGFRLLPGDNADAYHENPDESQVSQRITIRDNVIRWRGIYAIRVAGWGRSEVDHGIRRLPYRDVTIESCHLIALPPTPDIDPARRSPVVLEQADNVRLTGLTGLTGLTVQDSLRS